MRLRTLTLFCGLGFLGGLAGCDSGVSQNPTDGANPMSTSPQKSPLTAKPTEVRHVLAANAIQPHVAVDDAGRIYATFIHEGNIAVCSSTDRGRPFAEPVVAMDGRGRIRGGRQRGPRIGVAGKTLFVTAPVCFDGAELRKKYPRRDLYLVTSPDGGKTWSHPVRVNEQSKKAPEALHWLAVAPNGEAHVAWLDMRDRKRGQDIYYATYSNGKVGRNHRIAETVCECCAPGLAVDGRGNPFFAFRQGSDVGSREIMARRSADGGQTFTPNRQINRKPTREFG